MGIFGDSGEKQCYARREQNEKGISALCPGGLGIKLGGVGDDSITPLTLDAGQLCLVLGDNGLRVTMFAVTIEKNTKAQNQQ